MKRFDRCGSAHLAAARCLIADSTVESVHCAAIATFRRRDSDEAACTTCETRRAVGGGRRRCPRAGRLTSGECDRGPAHVPFTGSGLPHETADLAGRHLCDPLAFPRCRWMLSSGRHRSGQRCSEPSGTDRLLFHRRNPHRNWSIALQPQCRSTSALHWIGDRRRRPARTPWRLRSRKAH